MKTRKVYWLVCIAVLLCFGLSTASSALADDDDPPGRVARLSLATGQVSFNPAGTDDWVDAVINRPLTTGDKLWTDRDGRVELHTGSTAFRLSSMTGFSFLNLTDRMMQVRLTEGTLSIRVRRLGDDESIEIDTPNLAFSILRPGRYRVNVNEAGDTTILNVRDGEGEVTGGGSAYTVHAGERALLTGSDSLNADIEALADNDDFDNWCNQRDLREEHAASRRYVSDDVIGYEDLDDYGGWRPDPQYGNVWFPHVTVVDWAPYRYGHWAWISPWGWTWVDNAPWGFAPFHYGRWVSVRGAWGWVPCPPPVVAVGYVRPVYAPALVAWVGGPHFGVAVGVGGAVGVGVNVGWFPLGPREVYVPSYPVSRTYVNNVNISNTTVNQTVVNNHYNTTIVNKNVAVSNVRYVNQGVPGGVTATSGQNFTSARAVNNNLVRVDAREVASAPVAVAAPAIAPPKQAVIGSGAPTNYHPPAAVMNRAVVAKTAPPLPPPTFAKQQAAIQANQGRPISIAQAHQLEPQQTRAAVSPVRIAPAATPVAPRVNNVQGNVNRNVQSAQPNANRPVNTPAPNANVPQNAPQNANHNNEPGPLNTNRPTNTQVNNNENNNVNNSRPPSARPNGNSNVDAQAQEKQQQQLQQLEQKHEQQQQQLKQKQETEHAKAEPQKQAPPPKSKPSEDKPHH